MKKFLLLLILVAPALAWAQVSVDEILVENRKNPIGVGTPQPRFSWQLVSSSGVSQSAYELKIRSGNKDVWATGKVISGQSVHVPYSGPALESAKTYTGQVRVWDQNGKGSSWSAPFSWQMGLLQNADWKAKWITFDSGDTVHQPSPLFRKKFNVRRKVASATLFITSHGMYDAWINGTRIGDAYLTPGWTSYHNRLQYQQYDLTSGLVVGDNVIGVEIGNGWYKGFIGFSGQRNFYGKDLSTLVQLQITYDDGSTDIVVSDGSWKASTGSIFGAEIYNGETVNANKEQRGWSTPAFSDAEWKGVTVEDFGTDNLIATENEPVRKHETFKPVKVITTPKGEHVLDFGQNLVGWVQVKAKGKAGDQITIYHAEVLDKHGNFYTENLRPAKQRNTYILNGSGEEVFEPHFTFQGFRYIRIEGYPGEIRPENFTAIALYSDLKPTGTFECSNPLVNQLQHNIQWGQRGNFLDVPTDCPQRDERLGWTGDAQAFSRTATYNFGVNSFFAKWLKDVAADQINGSVPFVIPNVLGPQAAGSAGWADAATIIPWNMYLAYGDKRIIENQYQSMKAWVDYMTRNSTNSLWNKGFHFGDWLFYRPFDDNDGRSAVTDKYLIAQCFYAHSTNLVVKAATLLGKTDDASTYSALLKDVKDAFVREYVTPGGRLVSGTQTAYVLALNFDMLPELIRGTTADRLVENVKSYGNHLTTGFLGTPYLCHVLSRFGHDDTAYSLLLQESYPSWLYPVKMGATTIWERWDGIKPDSTFQTPGMNSFNHYAYGAIGDWMYRVVAGIDTYDDAPGYKHIRIKPHPHDGLAYANADLQTYYGKVSSHWATQAGKLTLDVIVPSNATATIYVPGGHVLESEKPVTENKKLAAKGVDGAYSVFEAGPGKYHFTTTP